MTTSLLNGRGRGRKIIKGRDGEQESGRVGGMGNGENVYGRNWKEKLALLKLTQKVFEVSLKFRSGKTLKS